MGLIPVLPTVSDARPRRPCSRTATRSSSTRERRDRLAAVRDLLDRGASAVVGDLSDLEETRGVAEQVNRLGRMDAVIHNAGVITGPHVLPVNVVAPYLLTALIHRPQRLVYLGSSMHRGGRASLTGMDWSGHRTTGLLLGQQALRHDARRRRRPDMADVFSNAVDPGWVPTRMGGPGAPDDLRLGHLTQEWLATSDDPKPHLRRLLGTTSAAPSRLPPSNDQRFQDQLLEALARFTATRLVIPSHTSTVEGT